MKFFIDTANLDQIREANELGVLDGVTTNPSLMAKEGIRGGKSTETLFGNLRDRGRGCKRRGNRYRLRRHDKRRGGVGRFTSQYSR